MVTNAKTSRITVALSALVIMLGVFAGLLVSSPLLAADEFASGSGTSEDPFIIKTAAQLDAVRHYLGSDNADKHFKLGCDIDLTEYLSEDGPGYNNGAGWEPIGNNSSQFTGTFDGSGLKITGLWIDKPDLYAGLFGYTYNANIKNTTIEYAEINVSNGAGYAGILVGWQDGGAVINCHTSGNVTTKDDNGNGGGLAGYLVGGNIKNCSSSANSEGKYAGGLVGRTSSNGSLANCQASGDVSGDYIGGLTGTVEGTISDCYFTGNVSGTGNSGGIAGNLTGYESKIINCYNLGAITGNAAVGGILGSGSGALAVIENCGNTGNVSGDNTVGGVAGLIMQTARIEQCFNAGDVSAAGDYLGGFIGYQQSCDITDCYSTGNIVNTGTGNTTGGFTGYVYSGNLNNCYAAGKVVGTGYYVGGLAGYISAGTTSKNCFFDTEASAMTNAVGVNSGLQPAGMVGLTTARMTADIVLEQGGDMAGLGTTDWVKRPNAAASCCGVVTYYPELKVFAEAVLDDGSSDGFTRTMSQNSVIATTGTAVHDNEMIFFDGDGTVDNPYEIWMAQQLNHVRLHLAAHYILMTDIDLSKFAPNDDLDGSQGLGWQPIGTSDNRFTGSFDGNNHKIIGLWIDRSSSEYVGLFGNTSGASIQNFGVEIDNKKGGVCGSRYTGGLVGNQSGGAISNSYVIGNITGSGYYIGGLVGQQYGSIIKNSYAAGSVTGVSYYTGGLVGRQYGTGVSIENCYAASSVNGTSYTGGLVGNQASGSISNSYATGSVTGSGSRTGGLVGDTNNGSISNSYATGSVTGVSDTGGLMGRQSGNISSIKNSYATGNVTGSGSRTGGLVGELWAGDIASCYARGGVTGNNNTGGLVGNQNNGGSIADCYYDIQATGQTNGVGGDVSMTGVNGLSTAEMIKSDVLEAGGAMSGLGATDWSKRAVNDTDCYSPELTAFYSGTEEQQAASEQSVRVTRRAVDVSGYAATAIYGQTLNEATLAGEATEAADTAITVDGDFVWFDGDTIPTVKNNGYSATFTPDSELYKAPSPFTVPVTVAKGIQEPLSIVGGNRTVTYGDAPFTLETSGGSGNGAVTWASSDPTVLSIDKTTGVVTIHKASDTPVTITATKAGGNNYKDATAEITVTVKEAELKEAHAAYISGYTDNTFRPDGSITRAEAATMFYNLAHGEVITSTGEVSTLNSSGFTDVKEGEWYYEAVMYLADLDIIEGYPDGAFQPETTITRAEFTTMTMRYAELKPSQAAAGFPDVSGDHWAWGYIAAAKEADYIQGYPGGNFGPEEEMTRAQAVTILNRIMGRDASTADFAGLTMPFNDVSKSHWAYSEIMEAAVAHPPH